jgi:hypothetical protein
MLLTITLIRTVLERHPELVYKHVGTPYSVFFARTRRLILLPHVSSD